MLAWLSLDCAGASRDGDAGAVGIGGTGGDDAGGGSETKRSGVGTGGPKAPDAGGVGSGDAVVLKTGDAGWAVWAGGDLALSVNHGVTNGQYAPSHIIISIYITHHSIASLVYKMACQATY